MRRSRAVTPSFAVGMINWDAIGAIGETVGALAVVVTLVYLARQVAYMRSQIRRQQSQDLNELFNSINCTIASSPELAQAMAAAEKGEELSHDQRVQFRHAFIALLNAFENAYIQQLESGQFDRNDELADMILVWLSTPAGIQAWEECKVFSLGEFRRFVDSLNSARSD